jgi:hypothetical protein
LDVGEGFAWGKRPRKNGGMGRDPQVPHHGRPRQTKDLGTRGTLFEKRSCFLMFLCLGVRGQEEDV